MGLKMILWDTFTDTAVSIFLILNLLLSYIPKPRRADFWGSLCLSCVLVYRVANVVSCHATWRRQVNGVKKATPLLLCLICIEMTDFVFAVDSIPAVLAISQDTFIVYASNVGTGLVLSSVRMGVLLPMKIFYVALAASL